MNPSAIGHHRGPHRAGDHGEVGAELAADDRLEGAHALVGHRLDQPAEVGAPVGRAATGRAPRSTPTTASAIEPHTATERHRTRWPRSRPRVTPTAGTKASTPPTSDPQIGMPSMTMARTSTPNATAVPRLAAGQPPGQQAAEQERGAGELPVREVAHAREPPADRRRVAEHRVQLQRRPEQHVDHEEAEHERRGTSRSGSSVAPAAERGREPAPAPTASPDDEPPVRERAARRGSR